MPPLHEAVQRGDVHRCRVLLDEARLGVDEADEDGHTALHWACDAGHMEVARCLLEHGAQVRMRCHDGREPLDFAVDAEVRKLLLAEVEKLRMGLLDELLAEAAPPPLPRRGGQQLVRMGGGV